MKDSFSSKVVIYLSLAFWPLGILLNNTFSNSLIYLLPLILVSISYLLHKKSKNYLIPIAFIGIIEPKLSLAPVIIFGAQILINNERVNGAKKLFFTLAVVVLIINFKTLLGQSIFTPDYEARQEVIRNTLIYDRVFMARLFHNKARIRVDKFNDRMFALLDPSNYFFEFQPRKMIIANQNLQKFPFAAIFLGLYGLYKFSKHKKHRYLLALFFSLLMNLSILNVFDRHDIVLWLPLSVILIHGVHELSRKYSSANYLYVLVIGFGLIEFVRIFI